MKKVLMFLLGVGLFITSFQAIAVPACNKGMIRDTYAIVFGGASGSCSFLGGTGTVKFGGSNAKVTAKGTESCDGVSLPFSGTGTYSVKQDCTGTATVNFDSGSTGTYYFAIAEGGNSILFMVTSPGVTVTGSGKKI